MIHSPQKSSIFMFVSIFCVICAAQITSDMYAPSMPAISHALNVAPSHVQFSMSLFMFGLAVSQLFYGVISEGIGRKRPLLTGLAILFLGNEICLFATNIEVLLLGRLVQGCGAGACASLWRSIFRDSFEGDDLVKYGSYLSILVTFIVPTAPVIGGLLQEYFNWRASFLFLSCYSFLTLGLIYYALQETSKHHAMSQIAPTYIYMSFKKILSDPIFMGYTGCTFLCYGAFFSWFTAGPFLLIHHLGVSPMHFGLLTFACGGGATAVAGFLSGRLVTKLGKTTMLRIGFSLMLLAGLLMLLCKIILGITLLAIMLPITVFYFGVTFIWPSAFAGAFATYGKMAGFAGAIYGFMQVSGAALMGTFVSFLPTHTQLPLALIFILTASLCWIVFEKVVRKYERMLVERSLG